MALVFDIEANGLLDSLSRVHCLSIYDLETNTQTTYNDEGNAEPIVRGVQRLEDADAIIGHNIIGYDLPAICSIYPWFRYSGCCVDTLLLSRLLHSDLLAVDKARQWKLMPLRLYGRHSLEAYGYRLGVYKGDFAKDTDWEQWSPEMEAYCEQDVEVTHALWRHFEPKLK